MQRDFRFTTTQLLDRARDFNTSLKVDIADFTALSPAFDATYMAAFDNAIALVEAVKSISMLYGEQKLRTEAMKSAHNGLYRRLKDLKYYVEMAWGGNAAMIAEFGLHELYAKRNRQGALAQLAQIGLNVAARYASELSAVGFDAAKRAELQSAMDAMESANLEQDAYINTRPRLKNESIEAQNNLYKYMREIRRASRVIYAGRPADLNRYKLPQPKRKKKESKGEGMIEG